MITVDSGSVPGQTVMMMMMMIRGLGSGQKGTSIALCHWSWLSLPHFCLCPGTTVHCPHVPCVVGGHLSAGISAVVVVQLHMNTDVFSQIDGSLCAGMKGIPV